MSLPRPKEGARNLKREIAAYQRLCEELPAHCRAMIAPYSGR
jgi:hypothetical protein